MVYGLGETSAQRVEHLLAIRRLQDRTGGFTAFIPWSFQPNRTRLPRPADLRPLTRIPRVQPSQRRQRLRPQLHQISNIHRHALARHLPAMPDVEISD